MKVRTRDNLIYLGVALLVAGGFVGPLLYFDATRGTILEIPRGLIWGILSTLGSVALVLEQFWKERGQRAVWIGCCAIAIGNVCFVSVVYRTWTNVPVVLLAFVSAVLLTFAITLLRRFVDPCKRL